MKRQFSILAIGTTSLIIATLFVVRADNLAPAAADNIAARVDKHIADRWVKENVTPAVACDDATYLRRVYLDVTGRIPPYAEVEDFLADPAPDKRARVVDRLLDGPTYVAHFSNVWRDVMLPEANADLQVRFLIPAFEVWLRRRLIENKPYDALVREILTTPLEVRGDAGPAMMQADGSTPITFYQAKQIKPENLAAATARMFLGVRIECAQCHDHPFDSWKQENFWSYAGFFAGIEMQGANPDEGIVGTIKELLDRRELAIPGKDKVVPATFLDGVKPTWKPQVGPRVTLADWVTSSGNPWFAKSVVNRMWGHFFGTGIVDPIDDFGADNPPSHPALLDELAREFVAHDYDLKFLIRTITATRAYQLSSEQSDESQANPRLFARMSVKGLTPAQLFDSVAQATGYYERSQERNQAVMENNSPRSEFLESFADRSETGTTDQQTTILQALAMMNGQFIADATGLERSTTLSAIADFPLLSTSDRIQALYLSAVSRPPRPDELGRLTKYVDAGGPKQDPKQALADVFWALLNSSEFLFNH